MLRIDSETRKIAMKKWLIFAPIIGFWGVVMLNYYAPCFKPYKDAHKMLMPNKYRVFLRAEEYRAVNFFKWKRLKFETKPEKCTLRIYDENGQCLSVNPRPTVKSVPEMEYDVYCGQDGPVTKYEYLVNPAHAGWYMVQCSEKSIWVIFPSTDFYVKESSWPAYPGCENVSDFEQPVKADINVIPAPSQREP